jgi:hypothetical protein
MVLAFFLARVLGEATGLPGVWAAVFLSGTLGALVGRIVSRYPLAETWPAFFLLAYLVSLEVAPSLMMASAAVTLAAFALNGWIETDSQQLAALKTAARHQLALIIAATTAGLFFLLYVGTLAPDVLPADSGELQTVATQLGVAHPPGFPLYVMAAHLFTRALQFVEPAYAVNLFSAVTSALTAGIVYYAGYRLTHRHLAGLIAAVALGTATTFWSQATTANVRSLTGLFAALILYSLIEFRNATREKNQPAVDRWLAVTALLMGLGLTHHVSLGFLIAIGLVFILLSDSRIIRQPKRWLRPIGFGLLGFLPLLYLPLRAGADVRGATAGLSTLSGFAEHVLATGFRGDLFYFTAPSDLWLRLGIMGNVMAFQFHWVLLVGIFGGLLFLALRDKPLAWLLGGTFIIFVLVAATYRAPQTVEYMIPAYIPAVLMLGVAVAGLLGLDKSRFGNLGQVIAAAGTAVLLVVAISQLPGHISASGARHESTSAREDAETLLNDAPMDSVILAHWHWVTPLWYLQEVEGQRPDVEIRFVFPEGEPYETTWERRIRESFQSGRPVVTTYVPGIPLADLPIPEPLSESLLYPQETRTELPPGYVPVELPLGADVLIRGYQLDRPEVQPGQELVLTLAWQPLSGQSEGQPLYIHLVGEDGKLYGQADQTVIAAEGITLSQFRITPRPTTPSGLAELIAGIPATDASNDNRQVLVDVDIMPATDQPFTHRSIRRRLFAESGETLVGYDWDHTVPGQPRLYLHWQTEGGTARTDAVDDPVTYLANLPPYRGPWGVPVETWSLTRGRESDHYVPFGRGIVWTGRSMMGKNPAIADTFVLEQVFHSSQPVNRDYVVSVRLIGLEPDGFHWSWWDLQDSIPAMGAIPTLKWIDGSRVVSPHQMTVQPSATPGQTITAALTLYDAFTNRPLPVLDERITAEFAWVPLGWGRIEE